jgi:hypothetical protein
MFESANRFLDDGNTDKVLHLLYLGDLDPSGEDMVRDIEDRLRMFGADVNVEKIALTAAQVAKYKPPPNPAKMSDPRAADFVKKFGSSSWEVDALPPNVLNRIVRNAVKSLVDEDKMDAIKEQEEEDKTRLREAVAEL